MQERKKCMGSLIRFLLLMCNQLIIKKLEEGRKSNNKGIRLLCNAVYVLFISLYIVIIVFVVFALVIPVQNKNTGQALFVLAILLLLLSYPFILVIRKIIGQDTSLIDEDQ